MALIGEIRKRSWLLLVVICVAMLAFVFSGVFTGNGVSVDETPISNLYGEGITSSEYQKLLDAEIFKYERVYQGVYGQPLPAEVRGQLEDGYLNQYLAEKLYQKQYDAIGLTVSKDEYNDILQGDHIDPSIYEQNRLFVDANGKFSKDSLTKLLPVFMAQSPDFEFFLTEVLGEQAEKQRLSQKYSTLISKGLYVTSFEAKKAYVAQNSKVDFDYVFKSFSSIPDSTVSVEESEIKAYYEKHKNEKKYESKDAMSFQYVEFPIVPSQADKELAMSYLDTNRANLFRDAENDTAFVLGNSDSKSLDFAPKKSSEFPAELDAMLQTADTGDIFGPYLDGEYYKLSKVRSIENQKEATVRHILLGKDKYGDDVTKLKAKADSIIRVIRGNNNFEAMVSEFSTDYASVPKGGVYEWFDEYQMVPEFTEVSFKKPIGTITTATTTYGVHIIEVQKRREGKKLSVATIDAEIKPSKETINEAVIKAIDFRNTFSKQNVSDTGFVNNARRNGLFSRPVNDILLGQETIPGFDNNVTQIQRWAFGGAKIGNLSDELVFDKKVVIAQLQNVKEEGVPSFASVKTEMGFEVIKEKKAAMFTEKMKGNSLQDIATAAGASVQNAAGISLSQTSIPGAGNEPLVIGTATSTAPGSVSAPIVGENGIFVVSTKTKTDATIPEGYTFEAEKQSATTQMRANVDNGVYQALSKVADLKDNRDKVSIKGN